MMLASNVTFRGTNKFIDNTAVSGGSIYLSDSVMTLNGINVFLNNTASNYHGKRGVKSNEMCYNSSLKTIIRIGSGGAIFCSISYLKVYERSNFTGNVAKSSSGGTIAVDVWRPYHSR